MKIRVRYNKAAGTRGSVDHKWRVFDDKKEYICKKVVIHVPSWTEPDPNGQDWNIACMGEIKIEKKTSTIVII